jgi:hypothetical protein
MTTQRKTQEGAWGIVNEDGDLLAFTVRHTREAAIRDFCNEPGYDIPEGTRDVWRWLKRRGNRCVPVTMTYEA